MRAEACESVWAVLIAYGKFQPSGISDSEVGHVLSDGKVTNEGRVPLMFGQIIVECN
jgi:hypothetical protein